MSKNALLLLNSPGLSRVEAHERSELVNVKNYTILLDLSGAQDLKTTSYPVTTTIEFRASQPGATTFLNYLGASVESVVLNGHSLKTSSHANSARILLPKLQEHNEVTIESRSYYSRSGEGLHRFLDPVDGKIYLYSQFEPADAQRVYPNMEQPDLKARFQISMIGPKDWIYASNGIEQERRLLDAQNIHVKFVPTKPISTYLTTFLAGPYTTFHDEWTPGTTVDIQNVDLRIFSRQSIADSVDHDVLFEQTKQGLQWFHKQFQFPYPWGKYDQAFVPEYNLGAMENPGLVTFNENYVFTSDATVAQHMQRATTLMHEMSHMWFGNLVTMRWWDDLWLKEAFADFYGSKAVAEATNLPGSWESFAHQRKAWAYVQDSYPTTHPIVADITDLEAARQNFDGITYAKGAAVIKQLFHYVGAESFISSCRLYFEKFAYATADLQDFLKILETSSGQDMTQWATAWLQSSGPSILQTETRQDQLFIKQLGLDPIKNTNVLRPHAIRVAVLQPNAQNILEITQEHSLQLPADNDEMMVDAVTIPQQGPYALITNHDDQTYAQLEFDQITTETITRLPLHHDDTITQATIWSTLWTMVRTAKLPATQFVESVCSLSNHIHDVSMYARILDQAVIATHSFIPKTQQTDTMQRLAEKMLEAMTVLKSDTDRQRSTASSFAKLLSGHSMYTTQRTQMLEAKHREELAPGLNFDDEMRWTYLISLSSSGKVSALQLKQELETNSTAANTLKYRTALAAIPDRRQQSKFWHEVLNGQDEEGKRLSNAEITAIAAGTTDAPSEEDLQRLETLIQNLEEIWDTRSNNLASRTINGLMPLQYEPVSQATGEQNLHPALLKIDEWLAERSDAPSALRRIVLERRTDIYLRLVAQAAGSLS